MDSNECQYLSPSTSNPVFKTSTNRNFFLFYRICPSLFFFPDTPKTTTKIQKPSQVFLKHLPENKFIYELSYEAFLNWQECQVTLKYYSYSKSYKELIVKTLKETTAFSEGLKQICMNTINGSSLFTAFTLSLARLIVFIHVQKKKNAVMQLSFFPPPLPLCSLSHKLCWLLRTFLTNIVLIQQRTLDHAFAIHLSDQRTQFAT